MFGETEGYDQSVSIYSPEGRIYQVEYARASSLRGSPGVAISTDRGVLIVAMKGEKSKLRRTELLDKIYPISKNIALVTSGLISDTRVIVDYARELASWHLAVYDEEPEINHILPELKELLWVYTEYGGVRPFGVTSIMVGPFKGSIKIYSIDVSGVTTEKKAAAIGNKSPDIEGRLEEVFKKGMTPDEARKAIFSILEEFYGDLSRYAIDTCFVDASGVGKIEHIS